MVFPDLPAYENIHPWWFVVFCNIVLITTIMMLGDITAFPCSFSFPTALSRRKMSFSLEKHFSYKRHHNNSEHIKLIFHFVGLERIIAGEVFLRVSIRGGNEPSWRFPNHASQLEEYNRTKLPSKIHVYLSTYCI